MHISDEQKQAAKQIDLVDYLISKGYNVVRRGNSYKIKTNQATANDMSSLSIFQNRMGWKRWSNGNHGGDTISFLEQNFGMTFQEAVLELTGGKVFKHTASESLEQYPEYEAKKDFKLPQKCNGKFARVYAYLTKTRMIDSCVVNQLMKDKKIYQDKNNNAVFVGYDESGIAKFACVRGTLTDKVFKGDCDGSDKKYSFSIEGTNKTKVYIFEAPIDLLSHATLTNKIIGKEKAWTVHSRIALAGTSDVALEHYLSTHPDVKELHFCLDNDEAGRFATEKYTEKYIQQGYTVIDHCPKSNDINEDLIAYLGNPQKKTEQPPTTRKRK